MRDFIFENRTKIIFGRNTEKYVGPEAIKYGKKALLHYGGGSIKKIGVYNKIIDSLKTAGIDITELGGVVPNPRLDLVYKGIELVKENNIDIIIAVGGGSVIDSAKAIAIGAYYDGDVWDFFSGKADAEKALPVATVLTIPAAGSESSNSSVITNSDGRLKRGYTNNVITPVFSILNPENTYSLPPYQIACGAADILAHLMERYFVNVELVDLTDRLIEGAMQNIIKFAPLAIENPENYDIRAEVMWVGTVAHNNLLDTGRGGDWASHGIEHELSGIYDIAHGAGLAIVFPAWMKYVKTLNPFKLVQFGQRVFGITDKSNDETIDIAIQKLEDFFHSIGLATRLSDINIDDTYFDEMAEKAVSKNKNSTIGSYVKLDFDAVKEIYQLAL
jgi:alcohol dehydrogenase YqhD (iron-dependent ADH family)